MAPLRRAGRRLGVHSAVSLPLITPDGVIGAMNVYARAKYAFDDRAAELGEIFAVPAAIAVQNAHVLAQDAPPRRAAPDRVGDARCHRPRRRDSDEPDGRH